MTEHMIESQLKRSIFKINNKCFSSVIVHIYTTNQNNSLILYTITVVLYTYIIRSNKKNVSTRAGKNLGFLENVFMFFYI